MSLDRDSRATNVRIPRPGAWRSVPTRTTLVLGALTLFFACMLVMALSALATVPGLALLGFLCAAILTGRCMSRDSSAVRPIVLLSHRRAVFLPALRSAAVLLTLGAFLLAATAIAFPWLIDLIPPSGGV